MIGQTLSHFQINAKLGEGGMGEVYRATDSKLGREVAIKVLPEAVAADPERLARFEREAKVLASLNHPNIAAIYQVEEAAGKHFLVMELAEGEDLKARLERGAIPVGEALPIALQIAEALEAAHEKGIIHRDLKPANVKVTPGGEVKVLDFGLAKALDPSAGPEAGRNDLSLSPTLTAQMTGAGVILGTAAYMSPEQAKGLEADRRADVWAFGVLVWEMLAGNRLFVGDSVSDTLAAVLRDEVDVSALPSGTPSILQALLARCLDRNPKTRLRDIGEARVALGSLAGGDRTSTLLSSATVGPAEEAHEKSNPKLPWAIAAVAGALAIAGFLWSPSHPRGSTSPGESESLVQRFAIEMPNSGSTRVGDGVAIAISPDGRSIVTRGGVGSDDILYLRSLEDFTPRAIEGTSNGRMPFFSPDGEWLGFTISSNLYKVRVGGGAPMLIGPSVVLSDGIAWADDGYVYSAEQGRMFRVATDGGEQQELSSEALDAQRLVLPFALPGSKVLLCNTATAPGRDGQLKAIKLDTLEVVDLEMAGTNPRYLSPGFLLFSQSERIFVAPFDVEELSFTGAPVAVLPRVWVDQNLIQAGISANGTVAYLPASLAEDQELVSVDLDGRTEPLFADDLPFSQISDPRISRDGRQIVMTDERGSIYAIDIDTQTPTLMSEDGFYPLWSPDGTEIVFSSSAGESFDIHRRPVDLSGSVEVYLDIENNLRTADWTEQGVLVIREEIPGKGMDLRYIPNVEDPQMLPLLEGEDDELAPVVSSDGKWMAFVSDYSGVDEIYVTSFPEPGGRRKVSIQGGSSPTWAPDGSTLYYFEGDELIAVAVETEPTFRVIGREVLFAGDYVLYRWSRQYDIHPSGERFILIKNSPRGNVEVITNWFEELKELTD